MNVLYKVYICRGVDLNMIFGSYFYSLSLHVESIGNTRTKCVQRETGILKRKLCEFGKFLIILPTPIFAERGFV